MNSPPKPVILTVPTLREWASDLRMVRTMLSAGRIGQAINHLKRLEATIQQVYLSQNSQIARKSS